MTKRVTLRFGDELLELECESIEIPTGSDSEYPDRDLPDGYIRLVAAESYEPAMGQLPFVDEGNTALVSDEHVAVIQWED